MFQHRCHQGHGTMRSLPYISGQAWLVNSPYKKKKKKKDACFDELSLSSGISDTNNDISASMAGGAYRAVMITQILFFA